MTHLKCGRMDQECPIVDREHLIVDRERMTVKLTRYTFWRLRWLNIFNAGFVITSSVGIQATQIPQLKA